MRTVKVKGMSCQHCAKAVNKALSEIEGVADVKVDLSKGEVSLRRGKARGVERFEGADRKGWL